MICIHGHLLHGYLLIEISNHLSYFIQEILEQKVQNKEVYTSEGDFGYHLRQVKTLGYIETK